MTSTIMHAEHPGEIDMEEAFAASEQAREWYDNAIRFTARLYVESAQEHPPVREALLDGEGAITDPQRAMQAHDRDRYDEIHALGLSANQGLSAEKLARRHLEE